jgi:alpha-L-fucosidase
MKNTRCSVLFAVMLVVGLQGQSFAETRPQRDARMAWWREARFGLFIHWGVYAVPAGEWKGRPVQGISEWIQAKGKIPSEEYVPLKEVFNPVKYDADEWVPDRLGHCIHAL